MRLYGADNDFNANGNNRNLNNQNGAFGIAFSRGLQPRMELAGLYDRLYSYDNLFFAYKKAKKHKTTKEINRYLKMQKKEDYASCTNFGKRHGIHPTTKVVGILPTIL